MATLRATGTVLHADSSRGTSAKGNPYTRTTVRVLVAESGVVEVTDFGEALLTVRRGDLVDWLVDVSVYNGALNVSFDTVTPADLPEDAQLASL